MLQEDGSNVIQQKNAICRLIHLHRSLHVVLLFSDTGVGDAMVDFSLFEGLFNFA